MAQDMVQWRAVDKAVINFRFPIKEINFLNS